VSSAVDAYLVMLDRRAASGELKACTVERNGYHLRSLLQLDKHGDRDLRTLTPTAGARLYEERTGAVDTHRNGLAVAKSFGSWCALQGWLKVSPFAGVKGKGRRKRGKEQLGRDEAATLYGHCLERAELDVGAVVTLAYLLLGARTGELLTRPVRDLDAGGTVLRVEHSKTANSTRDLGVPEVLQPHLVRLAKGRPALAPLIEACQHRKRAADWAREQVRRLCKESGVRAVVPQGLRGTMSTIAHEAHDAPHRVAAALGHTLEVNKRSYTDKDRAEAATRERALQVLQGGRK
jgi:integrase